jgi:hypothetical protein
MNLDCVSCAKKPSSAMRQYACLFDFDSSFTEYAGPSP